MANAVRHRDEGGTSMTKPAISAPAGAFSVFVLCTAGVGAAFGATIYAFAMGHLGVQLASSAALIAVGTLACRAVRPFHVALDAFEHWTGR
jgi:hypothetical protein